MDEGSADTVNTAVKRKNVRTLGSRLGYFTVLYWEPTSKYMAYPGYRTTETYVDFIKSSVHWKRFTEVK